MNGLVQTINAIRNVGRSDFAARARKVAVILSSPRSGSSLLKSVLASHPDIASMDGEIEPLLALTQNGFGYNSESDAIDEIANKALLADNLIDELSVLADTLPQLDRIRRRWENRLVMQFPCLFSKPTEHARLLSALDEALTEVAARNDRDEGELQTLMLLRVFRDEPWRIRYYDGHLRPDVSIVFDEPVKIEEPPFIVPRIRRRPLTADDMAAKTMLFKSPPDVYRIGLYEQLFPNAEVRYIHLSRGYAQSVNGLMDGWLSPVGFFSHDLGRHGTTLGIRGYSDVKDFGRRWWKFDLPPNWPAFATADLEEVCLNQWMSAHRAIIESGVQTLRVSFEEFASDPTGTMRMITAHLGLRPVALQPPLPVVMAIESPQAKRWRKRSHLRALGDRSDVRELMGVLGYKMDSETWL